MLFQKHKSSRERLRFYKRLQNDCALLKPHKLHAIKVGSRGTQYQASDLCSTRFHFLELSLGSISEEDARNCVK